MFIKHVVASARAQLFPLVITVENTFPLVITVENTFPLVITVGNTFLILITVGKNNGSSFFLRKRGTSEMSSMVRHTLLSILTVSQISFNLFCLRDERIL